MDPLSILFFSLQLLLKTLDVMQVIILFTNFLVPKLYPCSMFHTPLGLHLGKIRIHVLLPSFSIHLPLQTSNHRPFILFYKYYIFFVSCTFFDLSPYNLYHLNLCFLLPKKLETKIYNKTICSFSNFEIYRKQCSQ